jgi:hypothetical protein
MTNQRADRFTEKLTKLATEGEALKELRRPLREEDS